ncbi:MAG: ATP-dependent sacrificial sulfur transferase LarE [Clostridiales bacterium]|nr:ATP-dependent sacrificial sulfur transferase LarE [Clostridiales bacterium]
MDKLDLLKEMIRDKGRVAVAFSGGVDSAFLLKVTHDVLGDDMAALTVSGVNFPSREQKSAVDLCVREGIRFIRAEADLLSFEPFYSNPKDRCYHCKKKIFSLIRQRAEEEGFDTLFDGTNLDDTKDYRPGIKALEEMGVISPLKDLGFTKDEIRSYSRILGLPGYDRSSSACLASRIPYGETITSEKLERIDAAEVFIRDMGIDVCRVRSHGDVARIEVQGEETGKVLSEKDRIVKMFKDLGFSYVTLDLEGFRSGSMNEVIDR